MATIAEALKTAFEHHQAGRLAAAEEIYERILEVEPQHADALQLLGVIARQSGRHADAVEYIGRAIAVNPSCGLYHNNLGNALQDLGKLDQAVASYQRALNLQPDYPEAWYNLGNVWLAREKLHEASGCYQRAVELKPDYAKAHNNLGHVLLVQGRPDLAVAHCRRALELQPDFARAHNNLGTALHAEGRFDEALACYQRAWQLQPEDAQIHSVLLGALLYRDGVALSEIAETHAEFERRQGLPLRAAWRAHANPRDPDRPLRVGFVSGDFGQHPVGLFLIRALENLDRTQCAVACYSGRRQSDAMAARFRAAATLWRDAGSLSDAGLAEQVRADRIDILVDLAGHTAGNRLLLFARKPAPVQITWIGGEGTTGLRAMDYLLADRHLVPARAEPYCVERVLRMPHGYVCYDPPAAAPEVGPLPALAAGRVRFGSFNNPAKINAHVVSVWAAILRRVPRSRLVLKYRGLDQPAVQVRLQRQFAEQGVTADRVELRGASPLVDYLASYNEVDIALDPFPFGGGVTTCDTLWMGVPVITCPGDTFADRHGLSHLSNVGLLETIAGDLDEYVELAVKLAGDLPRLAEIRAGLRRQVAASPLCDGPRFAENLMAILRDVWRRWCEASPREAPGAPNPHPPNPDS